MSLLTARALVPLTWLVCTSWWALQSPVAFAQQRAPAREPAAGSSGAGESAAAVDEQDKAAARRLGSEAFQALDARDHARAVERFTQALAHYDAPTLRLGRAEALEAQGKWLAALEDLRRAGSQPATPGEPASFASARERARSGRARLQARIPTLTVRAPAGAEVQVDGQPWASREARPVDPGTHRVSVQVGGQTWMRKVEVAAQENETVAYSAPAPGDGQGDPQAEREPATGSPEPLSAAPREEAPASRREADGPEPRPAPVSANRATSSQAPSNVPLVVAATTTAVLTVAAVATGWVALGAHTDYDDENRPEVDRERKQSLRSKALGWSWVNAATTAGAVIAGGMTAYFWFSPPATASPSEAPLAGSWLVGVSGSF